MGLRCLSPDMGITPHIATEDCGYFYRGRMVLLPVGPRKGDPRQPQLILALRHHFGSRSHVALSPYPLVWSQQIFPERPRWYSCIPR